MKLYIWHMPVKVYGVSMLMAVAESEEQAKELALSGKTYHSVIHTTPTKHDVSKLGPPTRVVDLPCAEWHVFMSE